MSDPNNLDAEAARVVNKVRRLMLIASATTVIAIGAVFGVIGYRVYRSGESAAPATTVGAVAASLPAGAKVMSTAVGDGHIVLTVEVGGAVELRTFDLTTLKPLGRLRLEPQH